MVHADSFGPSLIVYEEITGPYTETMTSMPRVLKCLNVEGGFETFKSDLFAIYYDPKSTPNKDKRSISGVILSREEDKFKQLEQKLSFGILTKYPTFKVKVLPKMNMVKSYFPLNGSLSLLFATKFVYPKMNAFGDRFGFGGPIMEIYSIRDKMVTYMMPSNEDLDNFRPFDYVKTR